MVSDNEMISRPLVSIIIPVYNTSEFLPCCLESVCNQTYSNLEIILVDNNSTDNSRIICQEYAKKDSRIVCMTETVQGLGVTRDKGIDVSHGEWLCFVDSDDYIHARFIEILLRTVVGKGCLTAQCRLKSVQGDDDSDAFDDYKVRLFDWRSYLIFIMARASEGYAPYGCTTNIHHRSLFADARFGDYRFAEDSYMAPRLLYAASKQPVAVIDQALYYYRFRTDSLLHSPPSLRLLDQYRAKRGALDFWISEGEQEIYDLYYSNFFRSMVQDYINLSIYFPDEHEKFDFLKDKIYENLNEARHRCEEILTIPPAASSLYHQLMNHGKRYILYGYGAEGKKALPALKCLGIFIQEIWDKNPYNGGLQDGVPFLKPHRVTDENMSLLITINDVYVNAEVKIAMREYGLKDFWEFSLVKAALRYGIYRKYLPLLLDDYLS